MDTTLGRKILENVSLQRGPGYLLDNLQNVLDALWKVSDDSDIVDRKLFDHHLTRLRRYFNDLGKKKCVRLTYACERGRPIARITLLERQLPSEQKSQVVIATRQHIVTTTEKNLKQITVKKTETPPPPPQTLLFLDVPNLTGFDKNKDWRTNYRYLDISRINWSVFLDIASEITNIGRENVVAFAYLRLPKKQNTIYKFSNACHILRRVGFNVETRDRKDIDPMMITDIMDPDILGFQKNRVVKIIERMPQQRFKELYLFKNPDDRIHNCQIFHYTRRNPETNELAPYINWFRSVRPAEKRPLWDTGW